MQAFDLNLAALRLINEPSAVSIVYFWSLLKLVSSLQMYSAIGKKQILYSNA